MTKEQSKGASPERIEASSDRLEDFGYKQELNRTMSLTDVVVYGLIYMVPLATLPVFGLIYNFSGGMPALVYLVAAFAMFFSALSYKEMAKSFPIAGSVYSYVRIGLNRFMGFIAGWAILLDYLLLPALLSVFAAAAMVTVVPSVPAFVWIILFVVLAAAINLRGINLTAGVNKVFLAIQLVVLGVFVVGALVAVAQGRASFSLDPVFQPAEFSWAIVFGAIPIAALSFIGFDAISTLNEEAKGGGRAVSKATMIVLFAITVIFVLQVYLAAIFVPTGTTFAAGDETNNAFYDIAGSVVGEWFKVVMTLTSALIAIFANSIASQATSSRLVFSMARDGQLPRIFAKISPRRQVPVNAMLLIAGLSLVIGIVGTAEQELLTTLVTFGALTAYILLHVAVIAHFGVKQRSGKKFVHWVSPIVGIVVLGYALWNANDNAKIIGVAWLVIGAGIASFWHVRERRSRHPVAEPRTTH
ncbi:APC family permease [Glaciibacter superstes]|uniref:APC family permease n=1 Tax=Glaciibacter superstes TaxID=501023 RepID=UPI0003B53EB2|nr:APC family permease [Glaciibacter superstes]